MLLELPRSGAVVVNERYYVLTGGLPHPPQRTIRNGNRKVICVLGPRRRDHFGQVQAKRSVGFVENMFLFTRVRQQLHIKPFNDNTITRVNGGVAASKL